jgi:hypothetical protein
MKDLPKCRSIKEKCKNDRSNNQSALQAALNEGYITQFIIHNGYISDLLYPEQEFAFCHVVVDICPCLINNHILYRIVTPNGIKGYATKTNTISNRAVPEHKK